TTMDKIRETSMKGAEMGDKMTWGALWNACQAEQESKGLTGEELMEATNKRFRDVVYRTQVMDSTMTRSHVMRQKGPYAGMVTAFMSEPTLSFNMLMSAYNKYNSDVRKNMEGKNPDSKQDLKEAREKAWKNNGKYVQRTMGAYAATAILASIVESMVDAARDDDEYANYLERFAEKLLGFNVKDPDATLWDDIKALPNGNLMEDLLVHNKLPIVKDLFSIMKGQTTGRMDTEWMANITKSFFIARESLRLALGIQEEPTKITYNGNMTGWGKMYNILKGVGQTTGLPAANLLRDAMAIWNSTVGEIAPGLKIQTYDPGPEKSIKYALQDGYLTEDEAVQLLIKKELADDETEARQMAYVWANPQKYANLISAMNAGDMEAFNAAKEELEDLRFKQSNIQQAVTDEVQERYLGEGDTEQITKDEAVKMLMDYGGMIERKAEETVQKWTCELETGIPYSGIQEAYVNGDITRAQAKDMLMTYGGQAEEKAEKQIQKWTSEIDTGIAYSDLADSFYYGDITQAEAVDMFMKYGGKTREDAEDTALEIAFRRDYGRELDRTSLQDMYINGGYSRSEMKKIMLDYHYSKTADSAENSLARWDFIGNDMSLDAITPKQAQIYMSELNGTEIDKHTYLDYVKKVATIKGDKNENGSTIMYSKMDKVLAYIDSLDLTDEQKDALAMAYGDGDNGGYSEKSLDQRAPWRNGGSAKSGSGKKKSGGRGRGGGRGYGGRRGGGGGSGGLTPGAVDVYEHSDIFDDVLDQWRKRKLTRKQILQLVKEGKLTQEEADEILDTEQDGATEEEDELLKKDGLTPGAAEKYLLKK
ncbi:MAG: hypothetical protein IJT43_00600, partial [Stomatobaculum sp.]|nr:hypothetical protein [Stomatobaculum sp.]